MAYKLIHETNAPFSNLSVNKFIIDSADDVKDLPRSAPSSTAIVAQLGGGSFIVNASGEWVELRSASAREILLGEAGAYKQLVTNGDGKKVWEERLCYSYVTTMPIINETTVIDKDGANVSDLLINDLPDNAVCVVLFDGVEYTCEPYVSPIFGKCIGNIKILDERFEGGNGEPFLFSPVTIGMNNVAYFASKGDHTFSVSAIALGYQTLPAEYMPYPIRSGGGKSSLALNGFRPSDVTGEMAVAANNASAIGAYAFAVNGGKAWGTHSFANGYFSKASGAYSSAGGMSTLADGECQHVQGKFNLEDVDGKYAHIVGNGTDGSHRSNAYTLDWDGNAWFAGSVEAKSLIIASPNGTRFKVTVSDDGVLGVESIAE